MVTPALLRSGIPLAGSGTPPTYAHPPLVESWLGVEFVEFPSWTDMSSAGLRNTLGPEWTGQWREIVVGSSAGRQLTNAMGDRALRLTSRGFAFGWLGHSGERYPRYESVRDGFVLVLDAVRTLPDHESLTLIPRDWCVRYVNRIPRGTVWSASGDWSFFGLWQPAPLKGLGIGVDGFQARWDLPLEDGQGGRLTIEFQHAADDPSTETECVWINLTASGPVDKSESGLFDGLDAGRELIIRSFNELVSADAKTYWGVRPR